MRSKITILDDDYDVDDEDDADNNGGDDDDDYIYKLVGGEAEDKVNSGLLQLSPNPFPLIWLVPLALCKRSNIEHQCHLLLS